METLKKLTNLLNKIFNIRASNLANNAIKDVKSESVLLLSLNLCIAQLRAVNSLVAENVKPGGWALQPQEFEINGPDELTKNNAIIQA
uniref:Uncharacterized protein n=1 Tax=Glossina palpalis gambiensis TaxID=67801 RepID=A0A1B0C1K4_9MUSC